MKQYDFSNENSEEENFQSDDEEQKGDLLHKRIEKKQKSPKKNGKKVGAKKVLDDEESELHFPNGNEEPVVITPLVSSKTKSQSKKPIISVDDPNNIRYPEKSFSFTITNSKGDVDRELISVLRNFMTTTACFVWGAFALEVGSKAHKLHFQGTAIMRWPTGKEFISILAKHIKGLFPDNGKGYR